MADSEVAELVSDLVSTRFQMASLQMLSHQGGKLIQEDRSPMCCDAFEKRSRSRSQSRNRSNRCQNSESKKSEEKVSANNREESLDGVMPRLPGIAYLMEAKTFSSTKSAVPANNNHKHNMNKEKMQQFNYAEESEEDMEEGSLPDLQIVEEFDIVKGGVVMKKAVSASPLPVVEELAGRPNYTGGSLNRLSPGAKTRWRQAFDKVRNNLIEQCSNNTETNSEEARRKMANMNWNLVLQRLEKEKWVREEEERRESDRKSRKSRSRIRQKLASTSPARIRKELLPKTKEAFQERSRTLKLKSIKATEKIKQVRISESFICFVFVMILK